MITNVVFWIIGVLIGLLIGKFLADYHWSSNAYGPQRNLYNGRFYKVIEIKSKTSWENADIHREPIKQMYYRCPECGDHYGIGRGGCYLCDYQEEGYE